MLCTTLAQSSSKYIPSKLQSNTKEKVLFLEAKQHFHSMPSRTPFRPTNSFIIFRGWAGEVEPLQFNTSTDAYPSNIGHDDGNPSFSIRSVHQNIHNHPSFMRTRSRQHANRAFSLDVLQKYIGLVNVHSIYTRSTQKRSLIRTSS